MRGFSGMINSEEIRVSELQVNRSSELQQTTQWEVHSVTGTPLRMFRPAIERTLSDLSLSTLRKMTNLSKTKQVSEESNTNHHETVLKHTGTKKHTQQTAHYNTNQGITTFYYMCSL